MNRKKQIFSAIVEHFIETAQPVGSKTIIVSYKFDVSPATVRNDMAELEEEGLIFQPHTSAGRVPTDAGYRLYVDELADWQEAEKLAAKKITELRKSHLAGIAKQKVHGAVNLLSQATPNMAFATIPENNRTFFMGFSKILRQPEFALEPIRASQVMEVIEDDQAFLKGLSTLQIGDDVKIFIGQENILPTIESCSLIVTSYEYEGYRGYIGILGPKRMPYAFNNAVLKEVRDLLNSNNL